MKRYTHLIWDFNGTILNDVESDVAVANRLLRLHGLPELATVEDYRAVFGFPVIRYYERIGFDFSKTPFLQLAEEWMAFYREAEREAALYPGIVERLKQIKGYGIPQILLSATQKQMLTEQLESLGLSGVFDEVIGAGDFEAHGKADLAKRWKSEHPGAVPLMIGDTDHDAEAARAMGGDIVLLTCGHQAESVLKRANPLMICEKAENVPIEALFGM